MPKMGPKPDTRRCPVCQVHKPLNDAHFHKHPRGGWGFQAYCRICHNSNARQRKHRHRSKSRGYITITDKPRVMCAPSHHNPYNMDVCEHMHAFVLKHHLTVGYDYSVNWCTKHKCAADLGTCEQCADIAEAELVKYSMENAARRYGTVVEKQLAKQNKVKGWNAHHKGKRFKFTNLPAWDELWTDIEGAR